MKQFCKKASQGRGHDVIPYLVYDCSISNLQERAEQARHCANASEVQEYIGLSRKSVAAYTTKEAVQLKKRYFSKKLDREFAIRIDTAKQFFNPK